MEITRVPVLDGYRRAVDTYEGSILDCRPRVRLLEAPHAVVGRRGRTWDGDPCRYDPRTPRHHVFLEKLPPWVGVGPSGFVLKHELPPNAPRWHRAIDRAVSRAAVGMLVFGLALLVGTGLIIGAAAKLLPR